MSEPRWKIIKEADVLAYQPAPLVKALKEAAKDEGQEPPLSEAIKAITASIRADVKSGRFMVDRNQEKIPSELMSHAVALVVEFAKQRIKQKLSADEVRLADVARKRLELIALGKTSPSLPDEPELAVETVQGTGGAQLVKPGKRTPKHSDYAGL